MKSRQLTRWLIAKHTARLNTVKRLIGSIQLGFRTMSSNVDFGEKNTPTIRPKGLTAACASGAGRGVVAIQFPPPQDHPYRVGCSDLPTFYPALRQNATKISVSTNNASDPTP